MKELYIIRHGETDLNKQGIVQGRGINSDLNETGLAQSEAFFKAYKDVDFDKIYTSSLKRTHQTVAGFTQLGIDTKALPQLDELAWGEWEGKPNNGEAKVAFQKLASDWKSGLFDCKFEGGESPNEVATRLREALTIILAEHIEKKVLICMHGRALRVFMCVLMGKPLTEMDTFLHSNTTLYKVNYQDNSFSLIEANNTSHLEKYLQVGKD